MWIERKLRDPNSKFPKPLRFGDSPVRFWPVSELDAWDKAQARKTDEEEQAA
jgi:hypothetical protein